MPTAAGAIGMGCIGFPIHPVWEVTNACNLKCEQCHACSGKPMPNELTTEEGKSYSTAWPPSVSSACWHLAGANR